MSRLNDALFGEDPIEPSWLDDQPICSEDCPSHDGKRCEVLGLRPAYHCEPAVIAVTRLARKALGL